MAKRFPQKFEILLGEVVSITPYSASVKLEDYDLTGMIHISEIASGWVKDIRKHVKEGQTVVVKVMFVDKEKEHVGLSIKRVNEKQKHDKIKEKKQEQKAEKMFDMVAKELKAKKKEKEEIREKIKEEFGSLYVAFEKVMKNASILTSRGIPENWIENIKEIAERNTTKKEYEFKAKLFVKSHESNGLEIVKKILKEAEKHFDVTYISAPEYLIKMKTNDPKKGEQEFTEKLDKIKEFGNSLDAEVTYEISE